MSDPINGPPDPIVRKSQLDNAVEKLELKLNTTVWKTIAGVAAANLAIARLLPSLQTGVAGAIADAARRLF